MMTTMKLKIYFCTANDVQSIQNVYVYFLPANLFGLNSTPAFNSVVKGCFPPGCNGCW